eukprot:9321934-Pyramimonas_sp.AAC.1
MAATRPTMATTTFRISVIAAALIHLPLLSRAWFSSPERALFSSNPPCLVACHSGPRGVAMASAESWLRRGRVFH